MQDHDTQRVDRLYNVTKTQLMPPDRANDKTGNSAGVYR